MRRTATVTIRSYGHSLRMRVTYVYTPGEDPSTTSPGEDPNFEFVSVMNDSGEDILRLLNEDERNEIESIVLDT